LNTVDIVPGPKLYFRNPENAKVKHKQGEPWTEPVPSDIVALDGRGNDISDSVNTSIDNPDWNETGIHTITYTVADECSRTAELVRTVVVTQCDIPIITTKQPPIYDPFEDIGLMIHSDSHVLFNQNFMNNIVQYRLSDSDPWITANILSGTPDRKILYIKNPGVITSNLQFQVYVGDDNMGADGCYWTDELKNVQIISKEEQDKPLDVDGKASIVKKKNSVSRFDDLNFEPIYNKDLAYSSFSITADENSLMQNVYSILLTNLGERLYDDEFGSTLEESVFDIIGDLNGESKLLNQCVTLINKYEPRVVVVEDKSYVAINEDNTVVIVLYIKVPRGIARKIELTFRNDS
jgi:phage baseplate assembly protein W